MTSPAYLGLDIAKRKFDAALLHQQGRCIHQQFPNSQDGFAQLALWLQRHAASPLHACLEATGTYGDAVALFLHQQGHRVSVVNPARIKAFPGGIFFVFTATCFFRGASMTAKFN